MFYYRWKNQFLLLPLEKMDCPSVLIGTCIQDVHSVELLLYDMSIQLNPSNIGIFVSSMGTIGLPTIFDRNVIKNAGELA